MADDRDDEEKMGPIIPVSDPGYGKQFRAPERVVERNRGCYSCTKFENGGLAKQQWMATKGMIMAEGISRGKAMLEVEGDLIKWERLVHRGKMGLCMAGKVSGFCHSHYLCDGWTGKTGHSLATSGKLLDKLGDELHDIADSKTKKR